MEEMERKCKKCGAILEQEQLFCPKCGTPYGKKKKKNVLAAVLIPIAAIIAVIILTVGGLFVWGLSRSGWSFAQLKKIISEGHYSCLKEHDFGEANCQHGQICKVCGLEQGEITEHDFGPANCQHGQICKVCGFEQGDPIEHVWVEATCTSAKRCSVCGKTEGTELGHTTGYGKCSRCGQKVTELQYEYNQICRYFVDAYEHLNNAASDWSSACNSYYLQDYYIESMKIDINFAKEDFQSAAKACGSHKEFSKIKSKLNEAANALSTYSKPESNRDAVKKSLGYADEAYDLIIEIDQ